MCCNPNNSFNMRISTWTNQWPVHWPLAWIAPPGVAPNTPRGIRYVGSQQGDGGYRYTENISLNLLCTKSMIWKSLLDAESITNSKACKTHCCILVDAGKTVRPVVSSYNSSLPLPLHVHGKKLKHTASDRLVNSAAVLHFHQDRRITIIHVSVCALAAIYSMLRTVTSQLF